MPLSFVTNTNYLADERSVFLLLAQGKNDANSFVFVSLLCPLLRGGGNLGFVTGKNTTIQVIGCFARNKVFSMFVVWTGPLSAPIGGRVFFNDLISLRFRSLFWDVIQGHVRFDFLVAIAALFVAVEVFVSHVFRLEGFVAYQVSVEGESKRDTLRASGGALSCAVVFIENRRPVGHCLGGYQLVAQRRGRSLRMTALDRCRLSVLFGDPAVEKRKGDFRS